MALLRKFLGKIFMSKKQKILLGIVIAIVVALVGWRIYGGKNQSGMIKIAALLSVSGDAATWGQNAQRAIELATDERNRAGGVRGRQIQIIYEDTAGDPKKAVSAYQKVISIDNVVAVIGPLNTTEDIAVLPLIDQDRIPVIIPGFTPGENRKSTTNPLFVWMDVPAEAGRMAQYVYDQGIRSVGVIGTKDAWESVVSGEFSQKFRDLGGTVTKQETVQPNVSDMKLPVAEIVATHPQAVFLGTYYQFINSAKALHDIGYGGKLLSAEVDDYLASQTYQWTKSLKFIAPDFYTSDFVEKFKNKYGAAPGLPAGQTYDATNILFSLLAKSENPTDILQAMKTFSGYDGVSGRLQITPDGKTLLPTALFEIGEKGNINRVSALN